MITILVHRAGQTEQATSIDRAWLGPGSGVVPLGRPRVAVDSRVARPERHVRLSPAVGRGRACRVGTSPKIEAYDGYLYVIVHGLEAQPAGRASTPTTSTSSSARTISSPSTTGESAALDELREHLRAHAEDRRRRSGRAVSPDRRRDRRRLAGPESTRLDERIDALETAVFEKPTPSVVRDDPDREATTSRRCGACSRRSGTRWRGSRAASSWTSARRCRSASATCTTTSSGSSTTRRSATIGWPGFIAVGAAAAFGRRHWI